jgi:hypothetical protein
MTRQQEESDMSFWQSIEDPSKKRRGNTTPPANDPYALEPANGPGAADEVEIVEQYGGMEGAAGDVNTVAAESDDDDPMGLYPYFGRQRGGDDTPSFDGVADEEMLQNQWDGPVGDEPIDAGDPIIIPGTNATTEQLADDFNRSYLDPAAADTTAEEAYVNQRILDQLGQQQVASRARMGRAGFGSSGALAAMEGDNMRQANLDAEGRAYEIREREQNQAFDQGMGAQQMDINQDDQASQEALNLANANAVNALLDNGGDGDGNGVPDDLNDPQDRLENTQSHQTVDLGLGGDDTPGSKDTPYLTTTSEKTLLEQAGYVFEQVGTSVFGEPILEDQDGKHWFIRGQT